MEIKEEGEKRQSAKETKAHLEAMVLRTKPEANKWLHLNPRIAALGMDAFERGPTKITKVHAYLVKELNLAANAEEKLAEFIDRMCQITLEAFWTQNVRLEKGFERTDSLLEALGAGWTASFLARVYPGTLSLSDKGIPQGSYGIIYRRHPRTVCDFWSRQLEETPSSAAH